MLCDPETKEYLINYARSLIYTTALGFPFLALIRTAYEMLAEGETEEVGFSSGRGNGGIPLTGIASTEPATPGAILAYSAG